MKWTLGKTGMLIMFIAVVLSMVFMGLAVDKAGAEEAAPVAVAPGPLASLLSSFNFDEADADVVWLPKDNRFGAGFGMNILELQGGMFHVRAMLVPQQLMSDGDSVEDGGTLFGLGGGIDLKMAASRIGEKYKAVWVSKLTPSVGAMLLADFANEDTDVQFALYVTAFRYKF